jgi:hypothetical protein
VKGEGGGRRRRRRRRMRRRRRRRRFGVLRHFSIILLFY